MLVDGRATRSQIRGRWFSSIPCLLAGQRGSSPELDAMRALTKGRLGKPLVLILAGGDGTRIGRLGRLLPKPLMAISPQQTPLSRLLDQLLSLPHAHAIVSTAPAWSSYLTAFVERYVLHRERNGTGNPDLTVEINAAHAVGPISALSYLAERYNSEHYLICLADIVFLTNPFARFTSGMFKNAVVTAPFEADRGGVAASRAGTLHEIFHHDAECAFDQGLEHSNWTGLACLPAAALKTHAGPHDQVLEEMINAHVAQGSRVEVCEGPQFINMNGPNDLRRCWVEHLN